MIWMECSRKDAEDHHRNVLAGRNMTYPDAILTEKYYVVFVNPRTGSGVVYGKGGTAYGTAWIGVPDDEEDMVPDDGWFMWRIRHDNP